MDENIQMNIKFKRNNPEHKKAVEAIRSRSRLLGFSYATYITQAILSYEQMDQMSQYKEALEKILSEYDIKKKEKIIPKM